MKKILVVVPVYNEEIDLLKNVPILDDFLGKKMKGYDCTILIADNASIDNTQKVSKTLSKKYKRVKYKKIPKKGRGIALKIVWSESKADFLSYMDVDLSSDLNYFPKLIKSLENGADIAIGSRLLKNSKVYDRPLLREVMSRGYSLMFSTLFSTSFRDAQCGFKAITKNAANRLLPLVQDISWFFDSELLIIADKAKMKIVEVPIVWRDDPASTVKVAKTAWGDIKGLLRLLKTRPWTKLKNH